MIRSYLKLAFRTLIRNKTYSIINILGLVIGISFSCMLYIYVMNELSFDSFHTNSDRLYRALTIDQRIPDNPRTYAVAPPPLGKELVDNYPEVEDMVRLYRFVGQVVFELAGQPLQERNWYMADSNFFDVFDFEFVHGDRATALHDPHSLVLTESTARRYFGDVNPVGKMIEKCSFGAVKVTGVIKDLPDNSHLQFDMLFSDVRTDDGWVKHQSSWQEFDAYTYILLRKGSTIASLRSKMSDLQQSHFAKFDGGIALDYQPLEDIYLGSDQIEEGTSAANGQRVYIYIFATMGIFLLLIACINYINLATSKALARAREVGVRKVVGALRNQLVLQFLTESVVFTLLSMVIAISVMDMFFPYFNQITGKAFDINLESLKQYFLPLLTISLVVAAISGSYPAYYMASLKPVYSLKGKISGEKNASGFRSGLVVFQFTLSIVMIVSTIVIGQQLSFVQQADIGFDKDRLVIVDINSGNVRRQFEAMKNELSKITGVESVAVSSRVPGEWKNIQELYVTSSSAANGFSDSTKTYFMGFDEDMLETYQFTIESGSYFSTNSQSDSTSVLLNQSAVRALHLSEPLGATIRMKTSAGEMQATVIGVLKDFNFQSLHQKIAPIIVGAWNNPIQSIDYFTIKIGRQTEDVMKAITKVHEKFDTATPIEYHFLDQQLASFYTNEKRVGMIFKMGGGLSIFVACLGLFGLATYNVERRTKELGIRKALGASELNLFLMLSYTLTRQVGIAYCIATPIAYFGMRRWLSIFEYKISMTLGIFLLAGTIALLIAMITIGYRALNAAYASPIKALRQE